jgi:hypothetical protein
MCPTIVMGVGIPSWWPRKQVLRRLQLTRRDLDLWANVGSNLMTPLLDMADAFVGWWESRVRTDEEERDVTSPESPESPESPDSPDSTVPITIDSSDSESDLEPDISVTTSDLEGDIDRQWNDIEDWERL